MLNCQLAFWRKLPVVSRVPLLFDLKTATRHDFSYPINEPLVLALSVVPLEVGESVRLMGTDGEGPAMGLHFWLGFPQVGVVPGFVLEVEELFSFLEVHQIKLYASRQANISYFLNRCNVRLEFKNIR